MSVTNLTNTRWYFHENVAIPVEFAESSAFLDLMFTADVGIQYSGIRFDNYATFNFRNAESLVLTEVYSNAWVAPAYRGITIWGGADIENEEIITWLENNATYNGSTESVPPVRSLKYTTWHISEGWNAATFLGSYDVSFTLCEYTQTGSVTGSKFNIGYSNVQGTIVNPDNICIETSSVSGGVVVLDSSMSFDIMFTDGADLENANLMMWLERRGGLTKFNSLYQSSWSIPAGWTASKYTASITGVTFELNNVKYTDASMYIGYSWELDSSNRYVYTGTENSLCIGVGENVTVLSNDTPLEITFLEGPLNDSDMISWLHTQAELVTPPFEYQLLGTWVFKETIDSLSEFYQGAVTFVSAGVEYKYILKDTNTLHYQFSASTQEPYCYHVSEGWKYDEHRILAITHVADIDKQVLYDCLTKVATRISPLNIYGGSGVIFDEGFVDSAIGVRGVDGFISALILPSALPVIHAGAFYNNQTLTKVVLNANLLEIDIKAFSFCNNLTHLEFAGDSTIWQNVIKRIGWADDLAATHVICTDTSVEITHREHIRPDFVTLKGGTYTFKDILSHTIGMPVHDSDELLTLFCNKFDFTLDINASLDYLNMFEETNVPSDLEVMLHCTQICVKSSVSDNGSIIQDLMFPVVSSVSHASLEGDASDLVEAFEDPEASYLFGLLFSGYWWLMVALFQQLLKPDNPEIVGKVTLPWILDALVVLSQSDLLPMSRTVTIPEQQVDPIFANWFIANTDYNEKNNLWTTMLPGQFTFRKVLTEFPQQISRGIVSVIDAEQLGYVAFQTVHEGESDGLIAVPYIIMGANDAAESLEDIPLSVTVTTGPFEIYVDDLWNPDNELIVDRQLTISEEWQADPEFATWFIANTDYTDVVSETTETLEAGLYNVKPTVDLSSFTFNKTYSVNFLSSFTLFDRIRLQKDNNNDAIYYITPQNKELEVYNSGNTPCWKSNVTQIFFEEDQSVPSVVYNLINALLDQPIPTTTLAKGVYKFNNDVDVSTPFEEYFHHGCGITESFVGLTCVNEQDKRMLSTLGISTIWNNNVLAIPTPIYLEDYKWGTNTWSIFLGHKLTSDLLRTHFLLKDTLVTESFATWYKANSNYEEINNNLVLLEAGQYMFKEHIVGIENSNITWLYEHISPYYPLQFTITDDPDTIYDCLNCCSINTKENTKLNGVVDMNNYTKLVYKSTTGDVTTSAYEFGSRSVTSEEVTTTQEFSGWTSDNMRTIELSHACYVSQEFFDWFVANTDYNKDVESTVDIPSGTYSFHNSIEPFDVSTNNSYELQFNSFYGEYDYISCQSIDSGWTLSYGSTEHEFIYECFNSTSTPQWKNDLAQKITIKSNVTVPHAFGTWFLENTEIVEVNEIPSTIQYGTNIVTIGMNQTASLDCTNTLMRDDVTVMLESDATITYKDNSQIIDKGSSVVFDCKDKFITGDISVTIEQLDPPQIYIENDTLSIYGEYSQGTTATVYVDDVETLTVMRAPDPVPDPEPDPDPTPVPQPFRIVNPLEGSSLNEERNYEHKVVYEYEFENGTPEYVLVNGVRSNTSVTLPIYSSGSHSLIVTITVGGEVSIFTYVDNKNSGTYYLDCDVTFIDSNLNTVQDTFRIYGHVDLCFAAGTLISTPTGYVAIENMNEGDAIHSYNWMTESVEEDNVAKFEIENGSRDIHYVSFNNGNRIGVTSTHSFMTEDGWKCIAPNEHTITDQQLVIGDKVQTSENTFTVVTNIETDTRIQPIYHITLAKNNCLVVASNEKFVPVLAEHLSLDWGGWQCDYE